MTIQQLGWELPATQLSWIAAFLSVKIVRTLFIIHREEVLESMLYLHINAIWQVQSCQPYPISAQDLSFRWSRCLNLAQRYLMTSLLFPAALGVGQHRARFGGSYEFHSLVNAGHRAQRWPDLPGMLYPKQPWYQRVFEACMSLLLLHPLWK